MSEYRNDPEYGKDDDYPMTCDKCGSTEFIGRWHLFPLGGETFAGSICGDCYKATLAPQPPVPPDDFGALLSNLSRLMSDVAHQIQLSIVSMHDEDSADALYTVLRDHEDVLQKLADMTEKRLAVIRAKQ